MYTFLAAKATQDEVIKFTTSHQIKLSFIPKHSPHFGGIWEAAVKSAKFHLKRILGDYKHTFDEISTVLCQIEACLNSRLLVPLVTPNTEGIDLFDTRIFSSWTAYLNSTRKGYFPFINFALSLEFMYQIVSRILEAVVSRICSLYPKWKRFITILH